MMMQKKIEQPTAEAERQIRKIVNTLDKESQKLVEKNRDKYSDQITLMGMMKLQAEGILKILEGFRVVFIRFTINEDGIRTRSILDIAGVDSSEEKKGSE